MMRSRLVWVLAGIVLLIILLAGRLMNLAIGDEFPDPYIPDAYPQRADVVDRRGKVLAADLAMYSVYANPARLLSPDAAAQALCQFFDERRCAVIQRRLHSSQKFVWVARHLNPRQFRAIHDLGLPGLEFLSEPKRIYPKTTLAPHVVGFVDTDRRGLSGIEQAHDQRLMDSDDHLVLSLDLRVQALAQQALRNAIDKHQAIGGMAMVASVQHGDILALVSYPDFDPNDVAATSADALFNRPLLGVYEMGSTMKTFTIASALDLDLVHTNEVFSVKDPIKVDRFSIRDFRPKKTELSVEEIMMVSSNIGTGHITMRMSAQQQRDYLERFGFFQPVNLRFGELGTPILPSNWHKVHRLTVSFGHGMSVSAAHMVQALAALVNDGMMVPLSLTKTYGPPPLLRRAVRSDTSEEMRRILRAVVAEGSGSQADIPGYEVGGKTGTAEKSTGRGYSRDKRMASFLAAWPMDDPQFVAYVMVDEPKPTKDTHGYATGGWVAAPVVGTIVREASPLLRVMPVPPIDDETNPQMVHHVAH